MATELDAGPWPDLEAALAGGGDAIKAAAAEAHGMVHGYVALQRADGQWGVRGMYYTYDARDTRPRRAIRHYVKAGLPEGVALADPQPYEDARI